MNNWKEGRFSSTQSSFQTKKSFNTIVNMNVNYTNLEKQQDLLSKYIKKSMKFYNKSYESLLKEKVMKKFDVITFKSIKNIKKKQS
jgi:hypothetical protein